MIGLILTIIIALAIAYFSRNGTSGISITIGDQYHNIPLFVITVGTFLLGILFAWIIEVPHTIAKGLQVMGLGRKIRSGNQTIGQLQNKINKLEIENIKLHERNKSFTDNTVS